MQVSSRGLFRFRFKFLGVGTGYFTGGAVYTFSCVLERRTQSLHGRGPLSCLVPDPPWANMFSSPHDMVVGSGGFFQYIQLLLSLRFSSKNSFSFYACIYGPFEVNVYIWCEVRVKIIFFQMDIRLVPIEKSVPSSLNYFGIFVQKNPSIYVWGYFWTFHTTPSYYCGFIVSLKSD